MSASLVRDGREESRKILEWKLGNKNKRQKGGRGQGQLPRPGIKGFAGVSWKRHHSSLFKLARSQSDWILVGIFFFHSLGSL